MAGGGAGTAGGAALAGGIAGGASAGGDAGGSATAGGTIAGGDAAGGASGGGSVAGGDAAGGASGGGSVAGGNVAGGNVAGGNVAGGNVAGGNVAGGASALDAGVPGDTCATAIPITAAGVFTGSNVAAQPNYALGSQSNRCTRADGRDVVYAISVPAATKLTVRVTALTQSMDLALNLVADPAACTNGPLACLGSVDTGSTSEVLTHVNGGPARTVLLIVDGYQFQDAGDFVLQVSFAPIPTGDVCETATRLVPGTPLTNQVLGGFSGDYDTSFSGVCEFKSGIDRAFQVSVPAGQRLTLTIAAQGFDPSLSLVDVATDCAANRCLAGADEFQSGTERIIWDNLGATARDLIVVVDTSSTSQGVFTINASVALSPPFLDGGATCSAPTILDVDGGTYLSTTVGLQNRFAFNNGQNCIDTSNAPDSVFQVTVPPNSVLQAEVVPAGWDAVLNVVASAGACGITIDAGTFGATCTHASDGPNLESIERVTLRNPTSAATQALLVVDGHETDQAGTFTLSTTVSPLPLTPGDSCLMPQVINASGALTGLGLTDYADDVTTQSSCTNYANRGLDRIFSIQVGPGQTLTAVVIPDSWDASIYLLDPAQCGMNTTCLNGSDAAFTGGAETATFSNTGAQPRTILIVVDAWSSSSQGTFDLVTSLSP